MTTPIQTVSLQEADFKQWVKSHGFATHGDTREQAYHPLLSLDAPNIEVFWREFVVPLTNRIATTGESAIRFREGVDPILQYIAGANYSLFIHLTAAKRAMDLWDETVLDTVYTRLASAFDVFEALGIKLHLIFMECRGEQSPLLAKLTREEFLKIAGEYYDLEYPKLHELYAKVGKKPPPITLPSKGEILDEFLKAAPQRKDYRTISGQIRAFRNALVHDVLLGNIIGRNGDILVPHSSQIPNYRRWVDVEMAADRDDLVSKHFQEVKTQCTFEIGRSISVINVLYGEILRQFGELFWEKKNPKIHELWGVQYLSDAPDLSSLSQPLAAHNSQSFDGTTTTAGSASFSTSSGKYSPSSGAAT